MGHDSHPNTSQTALTMLDGIYQDIDYKSLQLELQEKAKQSCLLGSRRTYSTLCRVIPRIVFIGFL